MRIWSFLIIPAAVSVVVASCGGDDSSLFNNGDGGGDGSMMMGFDATLGGDSNRDGSSNGNCTPKTCMDLGYNCGPNSDGCGGLLNCGNCMSPQFCGGGGYSKCGGNALAADSGGSICVPKTCAQLGYNCGPNSDGCGNLLNCGTCTAPQFCGGGGYSVCGTSSGGVDGGGVCMGKTCAQQNINCGPAGDGCGNQLDCGMCMSPQFCGGGGPSQCGGNMSGDAGSICVPTTCAQLGWNCGPAGDGCGNLLQCGSCPMGQSCGGGGMPGVCGSAPCINLCPQQVQCDTGTTSVTGRVIAGTLPQYGTPDPVPNVLVYVPNSPIQPFPPGVQCSQCGAEVSGNPLVLTTTAVDGTFTLTNMPVGANIPIVIQLGRWRRQVTVANVAACVNTAFGDIHMPRNKNEGNIPFTAISTGDVDAMECVMLKMGVDAAEFTTPGGGGRVELYVGNGTDNGGALPPETNLVGPNANVLNNYDQVLFPCWGLDPTAPGAIDAKTPQQQQNVINYTSAGGRVFATHYSYGWLYNDPPFSGTALWDPNFANDTQADGVIDTTFPKGMTFAQWMQLIGALTVPNPPTFPITSPRHDFDGVVAPSQQWVYTSDPNLLAPGQNTTPLHYTFQTPVGVNPMQQCGRVIYSDFHVSDGVMSGGTTFPNECTAGPMVAQEKALEYAIWDLASCVGPPMYMCQPLTCAQQNLNCGPAGDGCGNQIDCGMCPMGQTCGGGGVHGQCGAPPDGGGCMAITCAQQGIQCGPAGNGCGGLLDCGPCTPPATCGGGGQNGVCGYTDGGPCVPTTCQALGYNCGPAGDGCGGLLQCGMCTPPATCGGGGMPGVCGYVDGGTCVPDTCQKLGFNCGPAGDGCGGLLQCGTCSPPQTCGGGGIPGVCGGGSK